MSAAPPPPPPVPGPYGSSGAGQHRTAGAGPHNTGQTGASGGAISHFFRALLDLKFEQYVALKFSAIIYIILIAYFTLIWLGAIIIGIIAVSQDSSGLLILLPALFLGWIPALIGILLSRVGLEFLTAGIRTAINTGKLVGR